MKANLSEILKKIGIKYELYGQRNIDLIVTGAKPILEAGKNDIVWVSSYSKAPNELVKKTKAVLIVYPKELFDNAELPLDKTYIVVDDSKLAFSKIVREMFYQEQEIGIDDSAKIHKEAQIDNGVYIGPNCIIGKCKIKNGTVLHGNVFVYDNVEIGENVLVQSGTVIGAEGFGFFKNENNQYEKFPHIGGVIIKKDVEIGSNTVIDRGSLGDTIIGEGTKIDNLVHIAHNVEIGKNVVIIASAEISGSVKIRDNSWIAPGAVVLDRISIGKNVVVGLGAVVIRDIEDNATVVGNPAKRIK